MRRADADHHEKATCLFNKKVGKQSSSAVKCEDDDVRCVVHKKGMNFLEFQEMHKNDLRQEKQE